MLKKASLVESSQCIDSSLKHAHSLHYIVDVQIVLNFLLALGENASEFCSFAEYDTNYCLENQSCPIATVASHVNTFLSDAFRLCEQSFWVFASHRWSRFGFFALIWVNFEQVAYNSEMHKPANPQFEKEANYKDECKKGSSPKSYDIDEKHPLCLLHRHL